MNREQIIQYHKEQKQKGLLAKGENAKDYYHLIESLTSANLKDDEIVDILRNVNTKLAHDILFSYRLKSGTKSYEVDAKLSEIYLKEYIEDYNKNNIEKRLTLRTTKKRPRVLTREEVMSILFEKQVPPVVIFSGYKGEDEIVKSLVETGKAVFERRKTDAINKRIESSLKEDMDYIISEIEKIKANTL